MPHKMKVTLSTNLTITRKEKMKRYHNCTTNLILLQLLVPLLTLPNTTSNIISILRSRRFYEYAMVGKHDHHHNQCMNNAKTKDLIEKENATPKRKLITFNLNPKNTSKSLFHRIKSRKHQEDKKEEHPLRTDTFEVYLKPPWFEYILPKSLFWKGVKKKRMKQRVLFHKDGFVKLLHSEHGLNSTKSIGIWRLDTNGLLWFTFPYSTCNGNEDGDGSKVIKTCTLQYSTAMHLNPFGDYPKLIRGIVTRDLHFVTKRRIVCIRPIIATFYAKGIGDDTMDRTYNKREKRDK